MPRVRRPAVSRRGARRLIDRLAMFDAESFRGRALDDAMARAGA
jgi:hypothetical protein